MRWEGVELSPGQDEVRRLKVTGGWLYQARLYEDITNTSAEHPNHERHGWHAPTFVPDGVPLDSAKLDAIVERLNNLDGDMATTGGQMLVEIVRDLAKLLKSVCP